MPGATDPDAERALDALLTPLAAPPIERTHHVLDLGCGAGRLTRVLAARAGRVTAFDADPEALRRAQERNADATNVAWVLGDGESVDGVPGESVDVAIARGALRRIPSVKAQLGYVEELGRVLRPGGWAAFALSTDPQGYEARQSRRGMLRALVGAEPEQGARRAATFVPLDALGATAAHAGLALERIEGAGTRDTLVLAVKR